MREKPPGCDRAWIWPASASYGSPGARFSPLAAELGEDFFVVLAERGRGRVDARTAMGEGARRQWHAKPAVDAMTGGVAVNDATRSMGLSMRWPAPVRWRWNSAAANAKAPVMPVA